MKTVYLVRTIPVRDLGGSIVGWVRADVLADGARPTDEVYLRDGSALGQAEAIDHINRDLGLVYASEGDAVRDGLALLRSRSAATRRH